MKNFDPIAESDPVSRMKSNKKIPWEKKAVARAAMANGQSERMVARLVGISPSAAHKIKMDLDLSSDYLNELKNALPVKLNELAHRSLDAITQDKLEKSNAYQNVLVSKIAVDEARLVEGLPTKNVQIKTIAVSLHGDMQRLKKRREDVLRALGGAATDVPAVVVREESKRVTK